RGARALARKAGSPTIGSPDSGKCTTDGVRRSPFSSASKIGNPDSIIPIRELVVPRSMPTISLTVYFTGNSAAWAIEEGGNFDRGDAGPVNYMIPSSRSDCLFQSPLSKAQYPSLSLSYLALIAHRRSRAHSHPAK